MKQMNTGSGRISIKRLARFIPAVLWMAFIFYTSSKTGEEVDSILPFVQTYLPFISDFNWGHYVSYFVLAMTLDYGIGARADRIGMKLAIILLCGLYGVTDEYHQSFVGGRMPDANDIRNDMIGALVWTAVAAIPFIRRKWRKIAP